MKFFIYIFASAVILRFILNFNRFFTLKTAIAKQDLFIRANFKDASEDDIKKGNKAGKWVESHLMDIKKLVVKAGVNDMVHSYMEFIGYGHVQQQHMSVLDNILYTKDMRFPTESRDIMNRAMGYYKVEAIKGFNPIFWIEFIIFLPKQIVEYFASGSESKSLSVITKIIQLLYWIASLIVIYITNKVEITNLFQN